jgi:hypothetical protein
MGGKLGQLIFGVVGIAWSTALALLILAVLYGVILIVFRSAFGVELWNPFQ